MSQWTGPDIVASDPKSIDRARKRVRFDGASDFGNVVPRNLGDILINFSNLPADITHTFGSTAHNRFLSIPVSRAVQHLREMRSRDYLHVWDASSWGGAILYLAHDVVLFLSDISKGNDRTLFTLINLFDAINVFKRPLEAARIVIDLVGLVVFRNPIANAIKILLDGSGVVFSTITRIVGEIVSLFRRVLTGWVRVAAGLPSQPYIIPSDRGYRPTGWLRRKLVPIHGVSTANLV